MCTRQVQTTVYKNCTASPKHRITTYVLSQCDTKCASYKDSHVSKSTKKGGNLSVLNARSLAMFKGNSRNVLHTLQCPKQKAEFYHRIEGYRPLLKEAVAHHLRVTPKEIEISPNEHWLHGSFNLVVPIALRPAETAEPGLATSQFVILRFPLPYRVGELLHPGNADEKINCEAATYAWIQENCPTVPIPKLYGFGLSTKARFTHLDFLPWWSRWFHRAYRRLLRGLGAQQPSRYVRHSSPSLASLDIGYLLIETITDGEMLSESWEEKKDDARLQHNLQRDLARVILSLASVPLPRIGAFRMDDKGFIHLDNRPLSVQNTIQENEGLPLDFGQHQTFSRVDDFVHSQLRTLDNRLLFQPNAIADRPDAWYQMTSLVAARAIFPEMFRREFNSGPFVYTLTDIHRSNIFVDEDWNLISIIDLEFACAWPVEFLQPPYWLSDKFVDQMRPPEFSARHAEFVQHLEKQENPTDTEGLSSVMRKGWANGVFWVTLALMDPVGFTGVFYSSILPFYFSYSREADIDKADYRFFSYLWRPGVPEIIERKMEESEACMKKLSDEFSDVA